MGMTRGQFGAALGIATLAPTVFAFAGPNIIDARERAQDPENRRYLRQSQIFGAATVIGLGVAVGLIIDDGDWYTVGAATIAATGMVLLYENALRHPKGSPKGPEPTAVVLQVK